MTPRVRPRVCPCVTAERPVPPCVNCWHFSDQGHQCEHCRQPWKSKRRLETKKKTVTPEQP